MEEDGFLSFLELKVVLKGRVKKIWIYPYLGLKHPPTPKIWI